MTCSASLTNELSKYHVGYKSGITATIINLMADTAELTEDFFNRHKTF